MKRIIIFFLILLCSHAYAGISNGSASGLSLTNTGGGSSSVSVTASTPDVVISPTPGTGTFTVGTTQIINAQGTTTPYTILASDMGKTVTHNKATAVAVTLPQAGTTGFLSGVSYSEINLGAGAVTITPTTSTINGSSTLVLNQNQSAYIISDGTNWIAFLGVGGSAAVNSFTGDGALISNSGSVGAVTATLGAAAADTVWGNPTGSSTTPVYTNAPVLKSLSLATTGSAVANGIYLSAANTLDFSTNTTKFLEISSTQVSTFFGAADAAQNTPSLSTSTFTANFAAANHFDFALVHASCPCTIANPTNISAGQTGIIEIDQSATGSDTVSWGSDFKFAGATPPTLSTAANAQDFMSYYVKDSTHIIVSGGILNAH